MYSTLQPLRSVMLTLASSLALTVLPGAVLAETLVGTAWRSADRTYQLFSMDLDSLELEFLGTTENLGVREALFYPEAGGSRCEIFNPQGGYVDVLGGERGRTYSRPLYSSLDSNFGFFDTMIVDGSSAALLDARPTTGTYAFFVQPIDPDTGRELEGPYEIPAGLVDAGFRSVRYSAHHEGRLYFGGCNWFGGGYDCDLSWYDSVTSGGGALGETSLSSSDTTYLIGDLVALPSGGFVGQGLEYQAGVYNGEKLIRVTAPGDGSMSIQRFADVDPSTSAGALDGQGRYWIGVGGELRALDPGNGTILARKSLGEGWTATAGLVRVGCSPDDTVLTLRDDRFQAEIDWSLGGNGGRVHWSPPRADQASVGYFNNPNNAEFLFKVLDGCPVNGHYWVFFAAATDVEFEVTVTDTETGESKVYSNAAGTAPAATTDVTAFASCP